MKPTLDELMAAVAAIAALMRFFPQKPEAWAFMAKQLGDFISTKERLDWFVDAAIKHFPEWPGIPHFIALYATQYKLPRGIKQTVEMPGFSTAELESKYIECEAQERARHLDEYREQAKLLPSGEATKPVALLPVPREMPMPGHSDLLAAARSLPSRDRIRKDEQQLRAESQPPRPAKEHHRQVAELARELMRREGKAS